MDIPRYWAKATMPEANSQGHAMQLVSWGGSSISQEHAEEVAFEKVSRLAERVRRGADLNGPYGYGRRQLREELIREIPGPGGSPWAAITRNSYGALVLNTSHAMFLDVDLTKSSWFARLSHALSNLFRPSRASRNLWGSSAIERGAMNKLHRWLERQAQAAVRVYRTANGFRYLMCHQLFEPRSEASRQLMRTLGVDPYYARLCDCQDSYRARLSPKPFRCGLDKPPVAFPYEHQSAQQAIELWIADYQRLSSQYATCQYLATEGTGRTLHELQPLIDLHDQQTRANSGLPLA